MNFHDHFSSVAGDYQEFRPTYPKELYDYLATLVPKNSHVWDCGCGNGQATKALAHYFEKVDASDPSKEQLSMAPKIKNVTYHCWTAEHTELKPNSIDLITVAQAVHWFKLSLFYEEVRRVLKPGGILALWCYPLCTVEPQIDKVVFAFYDERLKSYWPDERKHIDSGLATLEFPFEKINAPQFQMSAEWTLDHFLGYLKTWSARQRCLKAENKDPVEEITPMLQSLWGKGKRKIVWPLHLILGKK